MRLRSILASALASTLLAACAADGGLEPPDDYVKGEDGKADASAIATILDFELDGELVTSTTSMSGASRVIQDQLLYTIGHLNGDRAVGRLDRLTLTNIQLVSAGTGKTKITYHAKMPVAWGSKTNLPPSYTFQLPRDVSYDGQNAFTAKYKGSCVDRGAHDVDAGSMWYYYRPEASGCSLAPADIVTIDAVATVSTVNTTGKFPEYHKVWEDNAFKVVAVFGKYEDGATTNSDAGIAAYNEFVNAVRTKLAPYSVSTSPTGIPSSPGVGVPDVTFTATLPGGKTVQVNALLVDNVRTAGATFDARYESLSTRADLIVYNGHAGLGSNVRALAQKGEWAQGQYVIVFMNGCDTYAYVDGSLAQTRASINPDDPTGTKYMEIVTNGMPAFFSNMPEASMALLSGLLDFAAPKTYETMFRNVDSSQIVLVTGEQDNVYFPGYPGGGGGTYPGMREQTSASQGETLAFTTSAPAGTYLVKMEHDPAAPGGDADLYVRAGSAPTTSTYDCRPYLDGSDEECRVTLTSTQTIHMHVNGYGAGENAFILTVTQESGGGTTPPPPTTWAGIDESFTVARNEEKRWQTPPLAAGAYEFVLSGGGDADLYVRVGSAPTTTLYDCRPYRSSSNETCVVNAPGGAPIHVMVRGYSASSAVTLVGRKQ
jgi:hypothetical protein